MRSSPPLRSRARAIVRLGTHAGSTAAAHRSVQGLLLVGLDGDVGGGVGDAGQHEAVALLGIVQEGLVGLVDGAGDDLSGAAGAGASAARVGQVQAGLLRAAQRAKGGVRTRRLAMLRALNAAARMLMLILCCPERSGRNAPCGTMSPRPLSGCASGLARLFAAAVAAEGSCSMCVEMAARGMRAPQQRPGCRCRR